MRDIPYSILTTGAKVSGYGKRLVSARKPGRKREHRKTEFRFAALLRVMAQRVGAQ